MVFFFFFFFEAYTGSHGRAQQVKLSSEARSYSKGFPRGHRVDTVVWLATSKRVRLQGSCLHKLS